MFKAAAKATDFIIFVYNLKCLAEAPGINFRFYFGFYF